MNTNNNKNIIIKYSISGFIIISILGTLAHFIYDWTDQSKIAGLFFAVNESTWEHMKLVFFPMIVYSLFIRIKLNKIIPEATPSILIATISGTCIIPVLYYTYTGILGYMLTFLNIAIFYISTACAFIVFYLLTTRSNPEELNIILYFITTLFTCMFFLFSYNAPDLGIFIDPAK